MPVPGQPVEAQRSSTYHYYLGVDPGLNGGIAVIAAEKRDNGTAFYMVSVLSMPATEADIVDAFIPFRPEELHNGDSVFAYVEAVPTAIFQIRKSDNAKLYGSYRGLSMALSALQIPQSHVPAKIWQRALSIPSRKKTETQSKWKNRLKAKAQQLFPDVAVTLATCDALLIAEYCRKEREGTK
jgi:hypothetical protein